MVEIIEPQPLKDGFEAVYCGNVKLVGGKKGQRWILLADYQPGKPIAEYDAEGKAGYFSFKGSRMIGGVYSCKGTIEDGKIKTLNQNASYLRRLTGLEFDTIEALERSDRNVEARNKAEAKAKTDTHLQRLAADVARIGAALPWVERSGFIAAFGEMVRKSIEDQKKR